MAATASEAETSTSCTNLAVILLMFLLKTVYSAIGNKTGAYSNALATDIAYEMNLIAPTGLGA